MLPTISSIQNIPLNITNPLNNSLLENTHPNVWEFDSMCSFSGVEQKPFDYKLDFNYSKTIYNNKFVMVILFSHEKKVNQKLCDSAKFKVSHKMEQINNFFGDSIKDYVFGAIDTFAYEILVMKKIRRQ